MQAETQETQDRTKSIGGSDAGVIVGVDPYKTELALYYEKHGDIAPEDISNKEVVEFGILMEPVIAELYTRRSGKNVRNINRVLVHKKYPWMTCNLDRDVINEDGIVECKNTGAFKLDEWGEQGTDEVPTRFLYQCQHNMAVAGSVFSRPVNWCDLPVAIHGNQLRIYHIERDDELIESLIGVEANFWSAVTLGEPPEADLEQRPAQYKDLFSKLYPGTNGETVPINPELFHWHEVRQQAMASMLMYEKVKDGASAHLLKAMAENAVMELPDGTGYRRKTKKIRHKAKEAYTIELMDFRYLKNP